MSLSALDSVLTGPLFTTPEMSAAFGDDSLVAAMLEVETALARAQARFGIVPPGLATALALIAPSDLDLVEIGRRTEAAGVPSIPFLKMLQTRLPPDYEPHIHKGATTQDLIDTARVLQMRTGFDLIATEIGVVLDGLIALASRYRATPCVGRTYGQHAAPTTFGAKAAVWLSGLAGVAAGLKPLRERVLAASLGGPVGNLAAFGAKGPDIADAFAQELALRPAIMPWHTSRARMAEAGTWLAMLIGALAKIASDVASLSTTEIGEVAEPHAPGRGGSSAMPHKRNPVSSTVILAAHQVAPGLAQSLVSAMAAAHERPAGAWHGEWHALPPLFGLAAGALKEAKSIALGLQVDPDRMTRNIALTNGLLFADKAAARLAPRRGREAAHEAVEKAAALVRDSGRHLADVLRDDPALAGIAIDDAFDLSAAVEAGAAWTERALKDARTIRLQFP